MKQKISVTAAIIEQNGLIFCARRAIGHHLAGYWEFPGGKIEVNESAERSLCRELFEELNLTCQTTSYFATNTHEYDNKIIELIAFRVEIISGKLTLVDHDAYRWLPVSELSTLQWAPADVPFIDKLQSAI